MWGTGWSGGVEELWSGGRSGGAVEGGRRSGVEGGVDGGGSGWRSGVERSGVEWS